MTEYIGYTSIYLSTMPLEYLTKTLRQMLLVQTVKTGSLYLA